MTLQLSTYRPRPIRHLQRWEHRGWRVKIYGISAVGDRPDPVLVEAIKKVATDLLPMPAVTADRYGLAFLYAHQGGNGAGFASVNWWANENELFHFQFESHAGSLQALVSIDETGGPCACVWDLAIIAHEQQAWMDTVLACAGGPDLDGYLSRTLEADV